MTRPTAAPSLQDRLSRLAAKPAALRLDDLTADWQGQVRAASKGPRRALAVTVLSHLYQGEELTARVCARIAPRLSLPAAGDCLRRQEHDETDHAIAYGRYLDALQGAPRRLQRQQAVKTGRALAYLERRFDGWRGAPEALILATQLLLEGEAMELQEDSAKWLSCPRLAALNRAITRDEARHVAFAKLYLPAALPALSLQDRRAAYAWLRETWWRSLELVFVDFGYAALVGTLAGRYWAARRWSSWQEEMRRVGLYQDHERQYFIA